MSRSPHPAYEPAPPRRRGWALRTVLPLLLVCAACSRPSAEQASERTLVVFAAASLREPMIELAGGFEEPRPGVKVRLQFAGSQQLRTQLEHGARADVFVSADLRHMEALHAASRVEQPERFAGNEPVVIVSKHVEGVTDFWGLPEAERIVLGNAEVPIGRYAAQVLKNAGEAFEEQVRARVVSEELNVRQVLQKVALGEADAGIVYRSDLRVAQGRVRAVEIPERLNVAAEYPIAVVTDAREPALAREWMTWMRSETAARALEAAGFLRSPGAVARP